MGSPKVGVSVLLLLAVGPLLLLAPWWPLSAVVLVPLLVLAAVYLVLIFAVTYKWWAKRQQELNGSAPPSECCAQWQAGRWDIDPCHAYLANVGDAAAYDVSVTLSGSVICTAETVPPFKVDRLSSSSGLPCYVNLSVRERFRAEVATTMQSFDTENAGTDAAEVHVQVRWRTASGEWRTQNARL